MGGGICARNIDAGVEENGEDGVPAVEDAPLRKTAKHKLAGGILVVLCGAACWLRSTSQGGPLLPFRVRYLLLNPIILRGRQVSLPVDVERAASMGFE